MNSSCFSALCRPGAEGNPGNSTTVNGGDRRWVEGAGGSHLMDLPSWRWAFGDDQCYDFLGTQGGLDGGRRLVLESSRGCRQGGIPCQGFGLGKVVTLAGVPAPLQSTAPMPGFAKDLETHLGFRWMRRTGA